MLDFEAALAPRAGSRGLIPDSVAEEIAAARRSTSPGSREAGARGIRQSRGRALAAVAADADGAVHRGATSQDVMDTAAMLVARRTLPLLDAELGGVAAACARLAAEHRATPMAPARCSSRRCRPRSG